MRVDSDEENSDLDIEPAMKIDKPLVMDFDLNYDITG